MEGRIKLSLSALRDRTLFSATLSVVMTLLAGVSPATAATKNIVGNDLTQPQSYSPSGLPADGDDLAIISFATVNQPLRLDGSAVLTASSLTNTTNTAVSLINGGTGVSTLTLTGSETVTTVPVLLANPNANLTLTGMTPTAGSGVGFLDLVLTRPGRISGGINRTLTISTAIDNGGNLLRIDGGGKINIGQPLLGTSTQFITDPTNYGAISGSGGLAINTSNGGVTLLGTHTYTGVTTINPTGSLFLAGTINRSAGIVNSGALSLGDPDVLTGQSAAGVVQRLSPVVSGAGTLTKQGVSTHVLNAANTYTGATTILSGVLSVDTLANGGQGSGIGASTNAAGSLKIGAGTLRYTGAAASTDRLFTSSLNLSPPPTPQPPATVTTQIESSGSGPLMFSNTGPVAFDIANAGRSVSLGGTNTDVNTFAPQITNNGSGSVSFVKTGPGTWKLTNSQNTYSGGTYVYGGTLLGTQFSSFSNNGAIYVGPNGALGFNAVINNNQLGTGRITGTGTVLLGGDSSAGISFAISPNTANLSLGAAAGQTNTLSGSITPANNTYRLGGGGGTLVVTSNLVSNGVGRWIQIGVPLEQLSIGNNLIDVPESSTPANSRVVLTGNNLTGGDVNVFSGIVEMGSANALGTGTIHVMGNGTVVPFTPLDQAFINRISTGSLGTLAISGDVSANFDFSRAYKTMLGTTTAASYSGTITPDNNTYSLGGGGGTLTFNSPLIGTVANNVAVSGNGLTSSTVVLNSANSASNLAVTDARLILGGNGSISPSTVATLTGTTSVDLGGKTVSAYSLMFQRNLFPRLNSTLKNGTLRLNGLSLGLVSSPLNVQANPEYTAKTAKVNIDFSGLSRLTVSTGSTWVVSNAVDSLVRTAQDNLITSSGNVAMGTSNSDFNLPTNAVFEFGATNEFRVTGSLDIGSQAGIVPQTMFRFPSGSPGMLKVAGSGGLQPVSNLIVRSSSFSETTLDLSNGTTDLLAQTFYAGRHGYTLGTKSTVIIGGANSLINTGRLYLGYAEPKFDLSALPAGTLVSGASDDRFEQRAGTVLAGALYFNSHAAGAVGPVAGDTMRSTYVLGSADSSAVLSVHQIILGVPTVTAKSRATIDFVNGRLETFDAARSTAPALPQQPVSPSEPLTIVRGLSGGGAANDYRTLQINLAATGTHTFAAGAGKTLQIESTALISGPGGLSIEGPGTVSFAGANTYAGLTTLNSGTLDLQPAAQTVILTGGGADVRDGRMNFLVASGADPAALQQQVHALLADSHATGFAAGQFRSGTATPARGLAYWDNSNGITVTPALYGDANLSGTVDFNDFLDLQNGFGTDAGWHGGDFNYDGVADFNDFLLLQNNFGSSIDGAAVAVTAQERAALTALAATVPEPGLMATFLLATGAMVRRGRARMRSSQSC